MKDLRKIETVLLEVTTLQPKQAGLEESQKRSLA
jgi:hypothetical protein